MEGSPVPHLDMAREEAKHKGFVDRVFHMLHYDFHHLHPGTDACISSFATVFSVAGSYSQAQDTL